MAPISYCCVDIETTGLDSPDVTCVATLVVNLATGQSECQTWYSSLGAVMSQDKLNGVIDYLYGLHVAGVALVTFNGLGFDWRVMCDQMGDDNPLAQNRVREMALGHHDVMFKFTCEHGYFASLQSFLEASDSGISKTGNGKDAITKWCGENATRQTQLEVLEYCRNDVQCLSHVYKQLWQAEPMKRKTKRGSIQTWDHGGAIDSVQVCLEKFLANPLENSWLRNPPDPIQMVEWTAAPN
jgi:uncharacterized protein YprB with RNaseH-like and TPR domain